jgi:PIN domain nuclease of toxin-antitoxin system
LSDAVLDSSAVLAVILEEPGADRVEPLLPRAKVSAVNVDEVAAKLRDLSMPEATVETVLGGLQMDVVAHDWDEALAAAFLRPATRAAGLSLGDRACLALGGRLRHAGGDGRSQMGEGGRGSRRAGDADPLIR